MRKKHFLFIAAGVFIILFVLLLLKNTKDELPVLFYQEGSEGFYPYYAEWSYSKGEISSTDNPLKIAMLPLNYQPDILYENQWFSQTPSAKTGRDVYIRKGETGHDFHVQTASSSDFADISLVRPEEISVEEWEKTELLKADYDANGKELTLVLEIDPMNTEEKNILLAARLSLNFPDKVTWKIFELDTEEYFDFQLGDQVVMTGEWLYGTNGEHPAKYPIRISLEDGTVEKLEELDETIRGLVADTEEEEKLISTRHVLPAGRYGEMTIWSWIVVTAENTEELFCLFEDETLVSAIHMQKDGIWNVYDGDGNAVQKEMKEVYQNELYFPQ